MSIAHNLPFFTRLFQGASTQSAHSSRDQLLAISAFHRSVSALLNQATGMVCQTVNFNSVLESGPSTVRSRLFFTALDHF